MRTIALILVALAIASPASAGTTYLYRVRTAPEAPVVAEAPRPPVTTLVIAPATTYRTSRSLAAILAELAGTPYRSIGAESFGGARGAMIDWNSSGKASAVVERVGVIFGYLSPNAVVSLDAAGHLTLRVVLSYAGVTLTSSSGIALGAMAFAPAP